MPIATLIAADRLEQGALTAAADRLRDAKLEPRHTAWLDEGKAADIFFDGDVEKGRGALSPMSDSHDIIVQAEKARRKAMLISDMDSTMIQIECIDELADYAGLKPQIAEVTERAMRGELDFVEALRGRVALLKGLAESAIAECLADRVKLMPGAVTLVRTMRGWGAHTVLVSGGFTHFTTPVAQMIGFDEAHSNVLGIAQGALTGIVAEPVVDSGRKKAFLTSIAASRGIDVTAVMAVGDGANDIPMIQAAGLGIAYHAKEKARAAADAAISYNDLTALLYAQGVPQAQWVLD